MKSLQILVLICFINIAVRAQENAAITIGINHTIQSTALNEDRTIQIYTPDGYKDSEKEYPVLYILNGQWYFHSGVSIQKSLRTPGVIPEMIVVGINDSKQPRWSLFGQKRDAFTKFLVDEVIQYIDANYRTTNKRVIFGWEAAAYYISELILKRSELFGNSTN